MGPQAGPTYWGPQPRGTFFSLFLLLFLEEPWKEKGLCWPVLGKGVSQPLHLSSRSQCSKRGGDQTDSGLHDCPGPSGAGPDR